MLAYSRLPMTLDHGLQRSQGCSSCHQSPKALSWSFTIIKQSESPKEANNSCESSQHLADWNVAISSIYNNLDLQLYCIPLQCVGRHSKQGMHSTAGPVTSTWITRLPWSSWRKRNPQWVRWWLQLLWRKHHSHFCHLQWRAAMAGGRAGTLSPLNMDVKITKMTWQ